MTAVFLVLGLAALLLAAWSYSVYPPFIRWLASYEDAPWKAPEGDVAASVEVLVSAAEEEAVIADRVRDLLAQRVAGPYRIAVGCDGSSDRTEAEARASGAGDRLRVVAFPSRRGKASVLNDLVATSKADVLVFTDANTRFEPGAVSALVGLLGDTAVGAVCGRLVFEAAPGSETPENLFWDRETRLKEAEGRLGVCLGANGAIYAARRIAVDPLPADTSMDDFLIPVRVARKGKRVVFAGDAVAREPAARDVRAEVPRRFRIGVGAGQVLRRDTWLWAIWRHPALSLAFFSRKAARWLAPVLALAALTAGLFVPGARLGCAAALVLASVALGAARRGFQLSGFAGRLYYFVVMNLALSAGVVAGLAGYARPAWKPSAR